MQKKVVFVIYRKWAFEIFRAIADYQKSQSEFFIPILITTPEHEFSIEEAEKYCPIKVCQGKNNSEIAEILKSSSADAVFFYGWSWIVKTEITDNFLCLVLHPSPLPKYRGGTPIQHQVINGEKESAVTVFKMSEGIDDGDIYMQQTMSLDGDLNDILSRMVLIGVDITKKFISDLILEKVKFHSQKDLELYPALRRRKPEDSEIKIENLPSMDFQSLNNMVRSLIDPYPNVFLNFLNKRILIQKILKANELELGILLLDSKVTDNDLTNNLKLALKLKDCYAIVTKFKIDN